MYFELIIVLSALMLDYYWGEFNKYHPLVGFGNVAITLERALNKLKRVPVIARLLGLLAWCVAVLPWVYLSYLFEELLLGHFALTAAVGEEAVLAEFNIYTVIYSSVVLYIAIGWRSLLGHAQAIIGPLKAENIRSARYALSMIVSRETQSLNHTQISNAATESVLENGADAIFSAIFWFLIAGVPGVVLYRLANTLDAMWGYKNERYLYFGWAAARIDDVLNYIPARLSALSYMLLGNGALAWQCWRAQGVNWKSPNAGPVMAAGAGALNVKLGGGSVYHGVYQDRPLLGPVEGNAASCVSIEAACFLVNRVLMLWCVMLLCLAFIVECL